jgi:hypothetical protein
MLEQNTKTPSRCCVQLATAWLIETWAVKTFTVVRVCFLCQFVGVEGGDFAVCEILELILFDNTSISVWSLLDRPAPLMMKAILWI